MGPRRRTPTQSMYVAGRVRRALSWTSAPGDHARRTLPSWLRPDPKGANRVDHRLTSEFKIYTRSMSRVCHAMS